MSADATPRDDAPHLPWEGEAQRVDRLLALGIVLSGLYGLALLPAVPALVESHPLLLELLRGSPASMINMGALARIGEQSLLVALVAGLPSLVAFDWLFWGAGKRWGQRATAMLLGTGPRAARRSRRLERFMRRFGGAAVALAYFLPVPSALVYAAAGWSGMRLRVFLVLDVLGALLWVAFMVGLGYAIGQSAVDVAKAISRYGLWLTLALVVGIVGWQMRSAARS